MKLLNVCLVACVSIVFCLGLTACGDDDDGPGPIVGEWEDEEDYYGWHDWFEVESDLTGEGEFWVFVDGDTVVYCEYDLEGEKDGDKFVFDAECDDSSDFDFEMECELDGPDELECEGTDGWMDNWEWTFEKQ